MIYLKILKKYKFLIFIITCFLLGFLLGPLIYNGFFGDYFYSFKIKWYFHIIMFFGSLFLTLALHELTHLFSFVASGYKNEAIIILFLLFYKNNNKKWRLKIDFNLLLLGGGMVMPDFGDINDENDYNRALKAMRQSLLAAPLFTLLSGLILFVVTLIFFHTNNILVPLSLYILLFSLFYTYLSSKEANQAYGDFKAYQKLKEPSPFSTLLIMQYSTLTPFFKEKLSAHLANQIPVNHDLVSLGFFNVLLDEAIFEKNELDFFLYERVYYYVLYPSRFSRLANDPSQIGLCQSIIFYLDKLGFKAEAERFSLTLNSRIEKIKINEKATVYLTKQTSHLLKLSDESEYINNPKNINRGFLSFILNSIPTYLEAELYKNKGYETLHLESKL